MAIVTNPPGRFDGQQIFGDLQSFNWSPMAGGAAGIDLFLGNPPGTTTFGNVQAFALSGALIGSTQQAVQDQIDTIASYANISSSLGLPTNERPTGLNFIWAPHWCYFLPQEFKPGSIQPYAGNQQACSYFIVFRSAN